MVLQAGYGDYQVSQQKGRRACAFKTHLKPVLGRSNLTVVTEATTTKLATESGSSGARTVGVEYAVGGRNGVKDTGGHLLQPPRVICRLWSGCAWLLTFCNIS